MLAELQQQAVEVLWQLLLPCARPLIRDVVAHLSDPTFGTPAKLGTEHLNLPGMFVVKDNLQALQMGVCCLASMPDLFQQGANELLRVIKGLMASLTTVMMPSHQLPHCSKLLPVIMPNNLLAARIDLFQKEVGLHCNSPPWWRRSLTSLLLRISLPRDSCTHIHPRPDTVMFMQASPL